MSSRGTIGLGKKVLAETKQLLPVAWLAFLTLDELPVLKSQQDVELDRKQALCNFDANKTFFEELTKGALNFSLAERLVTPIRESRAKMLSLQIGDLIPQDNEFATVDTLFKAITDLDSQKTFTMNRGENPFTGESADPWYFGSTVEMLYAVCWITPRWLEIATKEELEAMVTGHVYALKAT